MDDIGFFKSEDYNGTEITIYRLKAPNRKAELAIALIERWGLVTAQDGGEDSLGRAKMAIMPAEDVVKRACKIASLAIDEMDRRGWYLDLPAPKQAPPDEDDGPEM